MARILYRQVGIRDEREMGAVWTKILNVKLRISKEQVRRDH